MVPRRACGSAKYSSVTSGKNSANWNELNSIVGGGGGLPREDECGEGWATGAVTIHSTFMTHHHLVGYHRFRASLLVLVALLALGPRPATAQADTLGAPLPLFT